MIHTSVGEIKTSSTGKVSISWPPNATGKGFTVKGTVNDLRNHTVQDANNKYHRYIAVVIDVEFIRMRTFGPDGSETEIQTIDKATGKGFLNKFDHKNVDDPNIISTDTYCMKFGGKALPPGYYDQQLPNLHPLTGGRLEFWGEINTLKALELKKGIRISLKTKGDTILIESCAKPNDTTNTANYSGENVGKSWTDSISSVKQNQEEKKIPGQDLQGVDDSEWD